MKIKLIASDLDGTLLTKDKRISERTRQALTLAAQKGIFFVPATGRSFSSVPKEVLSLPGTEYVITSNGAAVYSAKTGMRIHGCTLEEESVSLLLLALESAQGTALEVFVDGIPYAQEDYVADPESYGATEFGIQYVKQTRRPIKDIFAFAMENKKRLDGLDFVCGCDQELEKLQRRVEKEVPHIYVTSSMAHRLEISHVQTGKGNALRWLLDNLGIPASQAMAFGDGDNDIPMLSAVKYSFAMENGLESCKKCAWKVTASNEADGVAAAIESFI